MSEPAATTDLDHDYDYAHPSAMRTAVAHDEPRALPRTGDDDDLDFPIPYSEEMAQQWAREDPGFHVETYRQDSCLTKDVQADLRRAKAEVKAGNYVTQTYVNGEWVIVGA